MESESRPMLDQIIYPEKLATFKLQKQSLERRKSSDPNTTKKKCVAGSVGLSLLDDP
jgi:hypothetical protein